MPRKPMTESDTVYALQTGGRSREQIRFALRIFRSAGYTLTQSRRMLRSVLESNEVIDGNLVLLCNMVVQATAVLKRAWGK